MSAIPSRLKFIQELQKPVRSKLKGYQKQPPPKRWNIVRGDTVQVVNRRHPEFGKQGKVKVVMRETMRAIVENINLREKELPADPERGTKAETVMEENSVHYSTLNLVDPVTGFPTKINWSYLEDGTKVRISKRSGAIIPKPVHKKTLSYTVSEDSDTLKVEDVWAETYVEKVSKWEDMRNELLKMEKKRLEE